MPECVGGLVGGEMGEVKFITFSFLKDLWIGVLKFEPMKNMIFTNYS